MFFMKNNSYYLANYLTKANIFIKKGTLILKFLLREFQNESYRNIRAYIKILYKFYLPYGDLISWTGNFVNFHGNCIIDR